MLGSAVPFTDWCDEAVSDIGDHQLCLLNGRAAHLPIGRDAIALIVPTYYASEERIADLMRKATNQFLPVTCNKEEK
jgi:hypothetical protein